MLVRAQAATVGVTPESPGVTAGGCVRGVGSKPIDVWIGSFATFEVGSELVRDPRIYFADLWRYSTFKGAGILSERTTGGMPDMVLGVNFLHSHRVLIAHSQRKMYFTYTSGTVFPDLKRSTCNREPGGDGADTTRKP